jgi:hypothetical protein
MTPARTAVAANRSGGEAVEPRKVAHDLGDHRAGEAFVQAEGKAKSIARPTGWIEIVAMRSCLGIDAR